MAVIDRDIAWPVVITDREDPKVLYEAPNILELARYVEYCNSDKWPSDQWVLNDAKGRRLYAKIEALQVLDLYFLLD